MIYRGKNILISLLTVFVWSLVLYNIMMQPTNFYENEIAFLEMVESVFSYYEYEFYTLILVPLFLVFNFINGEKNNQRIIRTKNKKRIVLKSIGLVLCNSFLFTFMIYLVGIIVPLLCKVISVGFIKVYTIQSILFMVLLAILGNFTLIIDVFTKNQTLKLAVPYIVVLIMHIFRKRVFNIFVNINVVVIASAKGISQENILMLFMLEIILWIGTGLIKLYISSEEEFL